MMVSKSDSDSEQKGPWGRLATRHEDEQTSDRVLA